MDDIGEISNLKPVSAERCSPAPLSRTASSPAPATPGAAAGRPAPRVRVAMWATGGAGLALATALLLRTGIPEILRLLEIAGWRLLWLVPIHLIPMALGAAGWRRLLRGTRAPGLAYLTWATTVREAVGGLLPASQVGGEVVGVRLLVRRAMTATTAGAAVVVQLTLWMIAQLVFASAGLVLLFGYSTAGRAPRLVGLGMLGGAAVTAAFVLVQHRWGVFGLIERVLAAIAGRDVLRAFGDPALLDRAIRALYGDRRALARCITSQLAAMFAGATELWVTLRLLGHPIGLRAALVVESLTMAIQSAAFFVPAGLGTQEGSFVLFGGAVGLPPQVALALSLATRARQMLVGVPALGTWLLAERWSLAERVPRRWSDPPGE